MNDLTLREKQSLFVRLIARLTLHAELLGDEFTFGNTISATGFSKSLHPKRLAIDLNLFIDGKYQRSTKAHEPYGIWWEQQHPLCRWGGRFFPKDGNHYSLTHGGVK